MVSWAGPTPRRIGMTGSVLPNLLAMTFEGEGVLRENAGLRDHALWFIAHEAAHFWLGEAVAYQYSRDQWITEGGADLLAFRIVAEVDPAYDGRGELQKAIDDCVRLSTGRGVASAKSATSSALIMPAASCSAWSPKPLRTGRSALSSAASSTTIAATAC